MILFFRLEPEPGPSFDRDVNVNGRRGVLNSPSGGDLAGAARGERTNVRVYGHNLVTGLLAFREESVGGQPRFRERQLEALRKMEEKLRNLSKPEPTKRPPIRSNTPKMAMFVLDISRVLEPEARVAWLPVKAVPQGSPDTTILYTLVRGNGELVMFGGIKKDASSITQQTPPTMDMSDTVSNSLHFITTPQAII
jgi:F-box protein 42